MELSFNNDTSKKYQKIAYRLLEPTIESIILTAKKTNKNEIILRKTISQEISIYGGIYLYLREKLPTNINDKSTCAKIASAFLSEDNTFTNQVSLKQESDSSFLVSSIESLANNSWSNPQKRLKDHFSNLNYILSEQTSIKNSKETIKEESKLKGIEEYVFDHINREDIIGNRQIIENIENIACALLHYSPSEKNNIFDFNQYILLSGLPGTGKTLISKYIMTYASKIASKNNLNLKITHLNFEDRWQNGPLENIKEQLSTINKGINPYIVFIDEIDLKFSNRNQSNQRSEEQVLGELLRFRGGVYPNYKNYLFIATTNKPQNIDYALKDVFLEYKIEPPKTIEEKINILKLKLKEYEQSIDWDIIKPHLNNTLTGRKLEQISLSIKNKLLSNSHEIPLNKGYNQKKELLKKIIQSKPISENDLIKLIQKEF